jgi:hypothetical protein
LVTANFGRTAKQLTVQEINNDLCPGHRSFKFRSILGE